MKPAFDAAKHEFTKDGIKLPSVTQILGAVGMYKDLDNIPKSVLNIAAERGSVVHRIIELYERRELDLSTIDPELELYFYAYLDCKMDNEEIFGGLTEFEKVVCSEKFGYCGIVDAVGGGWIIDHKTTAMTSPVHGLQLTAYWMALHPDYNNDKPKGLACGYYAKNGTYNFVKYPFEPLAWLSCLGVYKWMKKNGVVK